MTCSHSHTHHQGQENQKFLVFSLLTSIFLFTGKIVFGVLSGSAALLASAIDSVMDSASTLVNMFFLKQSLRPADKEYPFGYGKFEAFSGLIQGTLIVFLSLSLLVYSLSHLEIFSQNPEISGEKSFEFWGMIVVILSIIAPLVLSFFMKRQAEKTKSLVMEAEHSHFFADGIMNAGVLLGLLISYFFDITWVDSVIGIVISFWLIWGAKDLLKDSFDVLVDAELPEKIQKKIQKILENAVQKSEISGWHALRTRRSGMEYHIDVHLEFHEKILLKTAHDFSEEIENRILQKFPNAVILSHLDFENDL